MKIYVLVDWGSVEVLDRAYCSWDEAKEAALAYYDDWARFNKSLSSEEEKTICRENADYELEDFGGIENVVSVWEVELNIPYIPENFRK